MLAWKTGIQPAKKNMTVKLVYIRMRLKKIENIHSTIIQPTQTQSHFSEQQQIQTMDLSNLSG